MRTRPSISLRGRKPGEKGLAILEVALLAPWIFLLFAAIFDFGFYAYAAISVQNAARVAVLQTSANTTAAQDSVLAQRLVCNDMARLPNLTFSSGTCTGVTATASLATSSPDGQNAAQVTVTYTTMQLFPLPFLTGKWTFTRIAQAKI